MLTLKRIKQNSQAVVEALARKGVEAREAIAQVVDLDQARRALQAEADTLQANINQASKEIGSLMRQGQQQAAEQLKTNVAAFKEKVKAATERMGQIDRELSDILVQLPNLPHESVPDGRTADDNLVVRTEGELPEPSANRLPHWEVASRLGAGAKLERSLINFFLEENAKAGYQEVMPPIMVNADSAYATGQLPDKEGQMYHVPQDGFYLVPTAEVPLTNIYRDAILEERELPVRITAYTPCFRREAGSYGKDVRGLNRLHQFDKVEIVCIETPERSYDRLEEMVQHVELLLQKLELPYRVLKLCAGDMSFTSALTYDLEVYSAGQDRWLEVSSVSNFEDYQANRLQLRYRSETEKRNVLAHTLNGSSLALPRVVAALLENHQTPHGVRIPKALQPWMGVEELRWK